MGLFTKKKAAQTAPSLPRPKGAPQRSVDSFTTVQSLSTDDFVSYMRNGNLSASGGSGPHSEPASPSLGSTMPARTPQPSYEPPGHGAKEVQKQETIEEETDSDESLVKEEPAPSAAPADSAAKVIPRPGAGAGENSVTSDPQHDGHRRDITALIPPRPSLPPAAATGGISEPYKDGVNEMGGEVVRCPLTPRTLKRIHNDPDGDWLCKTIVSNYGRLESLSELNLHAWLISSLPRPLFVGPQSGPHIGLQVLRVSQCDLSTIPKDIRLLTGLHVLDVSDNHLKELPSVIGELKGIRELIGNHNRIRSLPNSLAHCKSLRKLHLADNSLSSFFSIPHDFSIALTDLDLSRNQFKVVPSDLERISSLRSLKLDNNKLESIRDNLLSVNTDLQQLSLSGNYRLQAFPKFPERNSLQILDLGDTQLAAVPGNELRKLDSLTELNLQKNQLNSLPMELGALPLRELRLYDNVGFQHIPVTMGSLSELVHLDVDCTMVCSTIDLEMEFWEAILKLKRLQSLHMESLGARSLPSSFFVELSGLVELHAKRNAFVALPSAGLLKCNKLTALDISGNKLTTLPGVLGDLAGTLKDIDVSANPLSINVLSVARKGSQPLLQFLSGTQQARFRGLNISEFPWKIVEGWDLDSVTSLDISVNTFSELPYEALMKLESLTYLDTSWNQVSSLDNRLSRLHQLSGINLSHCCLKTFPIELLDLNSLTHIDVSHNSIRGSVPATLFHLDKLKILDISNNLIEELPPDLANLRESIFKIRIQNNPLPSEVLSAAEKGTMQLLSYLMVGGSGNISLSTTEKIRRLRNVVDNQHIYRLDLSLKGLSHLPESFFVERMKTLTQLDLSGNKLCGLPEFLPKYTPDLRILRAEKNFVSALPVQTYYLEKLVELNLAKNQIVDLPQAENIKLLQLCKLDLSGNNIRALPPCFGHLENLQWLDVGTNCIPEIPSNYGNLSKLTNLNAEYNFLVDLPQSFGRLKNLTKVNLYGNKFSDVPWVLNQLPKLEWLNMDNNRLRSVPSRLGDIKSLTKLDISFNPIEENYLISNISGNQGSMMYSMDDDDHISPNSKALYFKNLVMHPPPMASNQNETNPSTDESDMLRMMSALKLENASLHSQQSNT